MKFLLLFICILAINLSAQGINMSDFPAGSQLVSIAPANNNGTSPTVPVSYNWQTNLSQTIYLQSEIGFTGGSISHLVYEFTGFGDIPDDVPVSMWLANIPATKTEFAGNGDWIPFAQFTRIWNAQPLPEVNLSGQRFIYIELSTSFAYTGGNLVVMSHKLSTTTTYNSGNVWTMHTLGANRTIRFQTDNLPINPQQPPNGTRIAGFPHLRLIYTPAIKVSGTISLESPHTIPTSGVRISVVGSNRSIQSNAAGVYSIDNIPLINTGIRASLVGFESELSGVIDDWTVDSDGLFVKTWNATLVGLESSVISGTVILNDTDAPVTGATVTLTPVNTEESVQTTTTAAGLYSFSNVFDTNSYTLVFSHPGYDTLTRQVIIVGLTHTENVTLVETLAPPSGVFAINTPAGIEVKWINPTYEYQLITQTQSEYVPENNIGTGGFAFFQIAHRYTAAELLEMGAVGMNLYQVDFLPLVESASYTIRIASVPAGQLNPPMTAFNISVPTTNTVRERLHSVEFLPDPYPISAGIDLWIAIEILATEGFPAAADGGPMMYGSGNLMRIGETGWQTAWEIVAYPVEFDANWLIWGHLVEGDREDSAARYLTLRDNSVATQPLKSDFGRLNRETVFFAEQSRSETHINYPTSRTRAFADSYDIHRSSTTDVNHSSAINIETDFQSDDKIVSIIDDTGFVTGNPYYYFVRSKYTGHYGILYSDWVMSNRIIHSLLGDVTIEIRQSGTGTPVISAEIILGHRMELTNSSGQFTFTNVRLHDPYFLRITFPGFATHTETITFAEPGVYTIHLHPVANLLTENFNSGSLPAGWINIGLSNPDMSWFFAHELIGGINGGFAAYSLSWDYNTGQALTPNNWLITRPVSIPTHHSAIIEYFVAAVDFEFSQERLFVYVFDADLTHPDGILASTADTELLNDYSVPLGDDSWKFFSHIINDRWSGRSVRFAFRHAECTDMLAVKIDEVSIATFVVDFATITGSVVEENSGRPLMEVTVTFTEDTDTNPRVFTGVSNSSGVFNIPVKNNMRYKLTANWTDVNMLGDFRMIDVGLYNQTLTAPIIMPFGQSDTDQLVKVATSLIGNYPNPFNPETIIRFSVGAISTATEGILPVRIDVYNIRGQHVRTLVDGLFESGDYDIAWNGTDENDNPVASGVYFYRMVSGEHTEVKRMLLMK
jgi:hypothetical protein